MASAIQNAVKTQAAQQQQPGGRELIVAQINQMQGAVKRALPSVMTPERFTRIAVSALSTTPKLAECHPMTFIGAMMTAAQLGLEPNTPLGQAYLIPFWNGKARRLECQSHVVYENDTFEYSFGLEPSLKHVPAMSNRGAPVAVYAVFKTKDDGYGYEVMSWADVMDHARKFSKSYDNGPWQTNTEEMAKKTVLKKVLKYAPLSSEFVKGTMADGTVKDQIGDDMSDIPSLVIDADTGEVLDGSAADGN